MRSLSLKSRIGRTGCSVTALATALLVGPTPAIAQSFQGTGTVFSGSGTITTGVNSTDIAVTTAQTVIDWVPFDNAVGNFGAIGFQYSGTTATFAGSGNFAVLNRINPADSTRTISMDGIIKTASLGFAGASNGSIYFYSPSGFVIGSNARIDVGSLVLSASPIFVDGSGNFISGTSNQVIFGQALRPASAITTVIGSQIKATGADSYVAMVAPRVQHGGSINVAGSAALVAAEGATINFSPDGLFDIQVTSGSSDSQGIVVNGGSITGSASGGPTDVRRTYLVAVPKNNAMTMLLTAGSTLGFDIAGAANVVGNTVVLSAGYDVVDGVMSTTRSALGGTGTSNLTVYDSDFTSQVNASATGQGLFAAFSTTANMAAGLYLRAANAQFNAFDTGVHQVAGSVTLDTTNLGTGTGATGGITFAVATSGGRINIAGDLSMLSQAAGAAGVSGTGGSADVAVNSGGAMTIGGTLRLNADGVGGTGSTGTGGTVRIAVDGNSSLSAARLNASADGIGGNDSGSGAGNGIGGSASLRATGAGASIAIANVVTTGTANQRDFISVEGYGGQTNGGGTGIGGTGTGGSVSISGSAGGMLSLPNIADTTGVRIMARGYGGNASANGTTGGLGQAGSITLALDNATLTAGPLHLSAFGFGGSSTGTGNITGGNGIGGTRSISAINGSTLTFAAPAGVAGGGGGNGSGTGNGGNASGGNATLLVDNSTVNLVSKTIIVAQQMGGTGASGGNASGGNASVTIRNGGIVNVANDPSTPDDFAIGSNSFGGSGTGAAGNGGNATAGNVNLTLQGGTINLTGGMVGSAQASGGSASGSGNGGNATGGNVSAFATGASNAITGAGTASFVANASGGFSLSGTGGNATGGFANVSTNNGATLTIASQLAVAASGFGGGGGTAGGAGIGGTAQIFAASGSNLTIGGVTLLEAEGIGGGDGESNGNGGLGDGGTAAVYSGGGTITFKNDVTASAAATGGSATSGTGGNAVGGSAKVQTDGGAILVSGNLTLNGSATGGTGATGGNATALVSPITNEAAPTALSLYVGNGGSITVDGAATLDGRATGGTGFGGNGGNASGGESDVVAYVGDISLGSLSLNVSGQGGNGGNGGNGGTGQGGVAELTFEVGSAVVSGTITLGNTTISADGYGGNGGAGINNNFGGNGGAGGAGSGGSILFTGSAAGGTLDSGNAILTARGGGGSAGAGGNGDSGTGGNGGSGGAGTGGSIQTGTISNSGSPSSGGGVAYDALSIDTSATGGNGGNGGSGGGGNGSGGDGGDAAGGTSSFLIRGVMGTADSVTLLANATGGNGGSGSTSGDGGDARTGIITVESKDRFDVPSQRGNLIANSITGSAFATGGSGATAGTSTVRDGSYFRVLNGDATIGSVSITLSGTLIDSTGGPSFVSARDGTATVGSLSFVTDGTLALDADKGSMTADSITLNAADFVPHVLDPVPAIGGTFFADSFNIQTGNNFITAAHLDSVATLSIVAPGAILIGNVTGDNDIILNAQGGEVDIGTVVAGGGIDLDALTFIATGDITGDGIIDIDAGSSIVTGSILNTANTSLNAGTFISVGAINSGSGSVSLVTSNSGNISGSIVTGGSIYADSDGDIFLSNLTAPGDIELVAVGDIMVGNATAGETIDLDAGGYIDGGSMTAGNSVYVTAGGYVDLLDISAGIVDPSSGYDADYDVGILAGTTIQTGDIEAANRIGLGAMDDIYTGSIDAGTIFLALGGGNMSFGAINAGTATYLADVSMLEAGGDISGGAFDPAPILAQNPVSSGGSITLRQAVTTGRFEAAAGTTLTGTTIDSGGLLYATSGGNMTFGSLTADDDVQLIGGNNILTGSIAAGGYIWADAGGSLSTGNLTSGSDIELDAVGNITFLNASAGTEVEFGSGGSVTGGNVIAGATIEGEANGAVTLGNLTAGFDPGDYLDDDIFSVGIAASGSITVGQVQGAQAVGFATLGNLTTGAVTAGQLVMELVQGNITSGAITTTDAGGQVYMANASMCATGGGCDSDGDFDPGIVLGADPIATGGSITINGPVTTGIFRASAGTTFVGGNFTAANNILIDSGGNMTLGNLVAGLSDPDIANNAIHLAAAGSIIVGNVTAISEIDLNAGGALTGGNITSGQAIYADAEGAISLGNLSAGLVNPLPLMAGEDVGIGIVSATSIKVGNVNSAESVGLVTLGSLNTGTITTGGFLIALAGTNMELGAINAAGRVYLANASIYQAAVDEDDDVNAADILNATPVATGGSILTGPISAARLQAAAGTTLTIGGNLSVDSSIALSSGGAMQVQNATAGSSLRLSSGGSITGGDLTAGTLVRVAAAGGVNLGDITIDGGIQAQDVGPGSPVEIFGASIVTGDISTDGYVGLYTPGALSVGSIDAGHDVIALVGDDAAFGPIITPERFFLAGYQMFALVNGGQSFNPAAVFAAEQKSSTGGSASFAGSSSTAAFEAYVGDDTALASLTTDYALIDTGGLFTLTGALTGYSELISSDIDIGATASINDGVTLVSRNASQTLIGDGLDSAGQAYRLSDAEVDRIRGGFQIVADVGRGAADRMIIGDLSVTRNANDQGDEYGFVVADDNSDAGVGTIRVVGDVTFNNLLNSELVYFTADTFELDAATGSVSLFAQGTTLGGRLALEADKVWVASADILAKLKANPLYSGRIAELNAPAAVQRPEGVIRAEAIELGGDDGISSLLVQNTGTTATPAGFLVAAASIGEEDGDEFEAVPSSIDLVINGQLVTEGGTITAVAARDLLVAEFGTEAFVAGSTINGCALVGPCTAAPPKIDTPTNSNIQLSGNSGLGDGLFGNEAEIDDGESGGDNQSSPIAPPNPLFDSRPLTQSADIDDPVSGAGNPSLYGDTSDEDDEECDGSKDAGCKAGAKGDGK